MFDVCGRGMKSPSVEVTVHDDRILLRVDDAGNPEFWVEICFKVCDVRAWLNLAKSLPSGCSCRILPMPERMTPPLTDFPQLDPDDNDPFPTL